MGNESLGRRINLIEVERIYAIVATISIYQVNAQRIEDIEAAVAELRDRGINLIAPGTLDPISKPFFTHEPIEVSANEGLPVMVYLAGPTVGFQNGPSSS